MFKPKLLQQNQGFTLVEVLVAILIATIFVTVAMQMLAIAAVFRVRAQEFTEATNWIQENLEEVKYRASAFKYTSLAANANSGASSITVASADDFVVNDRLRVGSDTGIYRVTGKSGTTLNLTPNLRTTQSQDAVVVMTSFPSTSLTANANSGTTSITVASVDNFTINDKVRVGTDTTTYTISVINGVTKTLTVTPLGTSKSQGDAVALSTICNPTTQNAGFADGLRDKIIGSDLTTNTNSVSTSKTSNRTGKTFILTRTTTLSSDAPYNLLQISYSVAPQNAHSTLAAAASATSTTLSVASGSGFKAGDKLTVGTDTNNEVQSVSGNTITLKTQLGSVQSIGSIVDISVATANTEVIPNAALQCPN